MNRWRPWLNVLPVDGVALDFEDVGADGKLDLVLTARNDGKDTTFRVAVPLSLDAASAVASDLSSWIARVIAARL